MMEDRSVGSGGASRAKSSVTGGWAVAKPVIKERGIMVWTHLRRCFGWRLNQTASTDYELEVFDGAGVRDETMRSYLSWRRSQMLCSLPVLLSAAATGLSAVVMQQELTDKGNFVYNLPNVANFVLLLSVMAAIGVPRGRLRVWPTWRTSSKFIRIGFILSFILPIIPAVIPLRYLSREDAPLEGAAGLAVETIPVLEQAKQLRARDFRAGFDNFVATMPVLVSFPSALLAGSLRMRGLLPESTLSSWILATSAPFLSIVVLSVAVIVIQFGGNAVLMTGVLLRSFYPWIYVFGRQYYVKPPTAAREKMVDRLQIVMLVLNVTSVVLIVYWLFTQDLITKDLLREEKTAYAKLVLEIWGRTLATTVVFTDVLLRMTITNWRVGKEIDDLDERYGRIEKEIGKKDAAKHAIEETPAVLKAEYDRPEDDKDLPHGGEDDVESAPGSDGIARPASPLAKDEEPPRKDPDEGGDGVRSARPTHPSIWRLLDDARARTEGQAGEASGDGSDGSDSDGRSAAAPDSPDVELGGTAEPSASERCDDDSTRTGTDAAISGVYVPEPCVPAPKAAGTLGAAPEPKARAEGQAEESSDDGSEGSGGDVNEEEPPRGDADEGGTRSAGLAHPSIRRLLNNAKARAEGRVGEVLDGGSEGSDSDERSATAPGSPDVESGGTAEPSASERCDDDSSRTGTEAAIAGVHVPEPYVPAPKAADAFGAAPEQNARTEGRANESSDDGSEGSGGDERSAAAPESPDIESGETVEPSASERCDDDSTRSRSGVAITGACIPEPHTPAPKPVGPCGAAPEPKAGTDGRAGKSSDNGSEGSGGNERSPTVPGSPGSPDLESAGIADPSAPERYGDDSTRTRVGVT